MKKLLKIFGILTVSLLSFCKTDKKESQEIKVIEPIIKKYNGTNIRIGQQVWMSENLNVNVFRNGDPIPFAETNKEWKEAGKNKQPAWCYYNNDPLNGKKYGKLYNFFAVKDPRGLAPKGWHVPSDKEYVVLIKNIGSNEAYFKMKSNVGWCNNGNGDNESGFNAVPGGFRYGYGSFSKGGCEGYWWTSTKDENYFAYNLFLGKEKFEHYIYYDYNTNGLSVRCLKD